MPKQRIDLTRDAAAPKVFALSVVFLSHNDATRLASPENVSAQDTLKIRVTKTRAWRGNNHFLMERKHFQVFKLESMLVVFGQSRCCLPC